MEDFSSPRYFEDDLSEIKAFVGPQAVEESSSNGEPEKEWDHRSSEAVPLTIPETFPPPVDDPYDPEHDRGDPEDPE